MSYSGSRDSRRRCPIRTAARCHRPSLAHRRPLALVQAGGSGRGRGQGLVAGPGARGFCRRPALAHRRLGPGVLPPAGASAPAAGPGGRGLGGRPGRYCSLNLRLSLPLSLPLPLPLSLSHSLPFSLSPARPPSPRRPTGDSPCGEAALRSVGWEGGLEGSAGGSACRCQCDRDLAVMDSSGSRQVPA